MKVIYKVIFPNGKIYVGQDSTDDILYFGSPNRYLIEKDFTKRWVREMAVQFETKGNITYRVMCSIFKKEDIINMNKEQFLNAVAKSKEFYSKMVEGVIEFLSKSSVNQDISEGIFFAPRRDVLIWEMYFEKLGKRPNVMYYGESSLKYGILKNWIKCKINKHNGILPKTKELQIFDFETDDTLQTN